MPKLTLRQVNLALKKYVQHRWKTSHFANYLQITIPSASAILAGRTWRHAKRPEGFQYPWPVEVSRGGVSKEVLAQQLRHYFEKPFSAAELGRRLKISRQAAHKILTGKSHKDVMLIPRSTTRYLGTELLVLDDEEDDDEEIVVLEERLDS